MTIATQAGSATGPPAGNPWSRLPRDLAPLLRAHVPEATVNIQHEIQRAIPEYSRPLDRRFSELIAAGVQHALTLFVDRVANPTAPRDQRVEMYRRMGRGEFREGRSLDTLQAAYRVGARIAWQRMFDFGERTQLSMATMRLLGEAVFEHIDELSALALEGYLEAQAMAAGTLQRRRRWLLELLVAESPAAHQAIVERAAAAHWELPEQIYVVALEARPDQHLLDDEPQLDDRILVDFEGSAPCLLVPEGIDREQLLGGPLHQWRAAVGPTVALADAAKSLHWARRALELVRDGVLDERKLVCCADHLSTLWLLSDPFLLQELTSRTLAPLAGLTPKQQHRLAETLFAWLETRSGAPEIAARLGIHPQTVRYRLHQLEDLFGDQLTDPDGRFDLELVLRAAHLSGRWSK